MKAICDIRLSTVGRRLHAMPHISKLKVEFNYSTIASTIQLFNYCPQKVKKKAFHYQCFPENLTKGFSSVRSSNLMLILINY